MLWIKLFLSLESFEIKFVSNVTMIRFGFSGHLVAFSGLVTSVLGSLFIYSMDDTFLSTFCSLYQRFCYSKAGPPGPHFASSDFTIVSLLFFLGSFVNYLSNISSVDSITATHLNFLEISSQSILRSFNTAFTSSLRLQLLLAQSQPFWATLLYMRSLRI